MYKNSNFKRTLISLLIGAIGTPQILFAAPDPWPLAQYPAGAASRMPAPNVIVSVDNSGSMGDAGIKALKDALKEAFKPENVPDDSIRLAYQSMWSCNTIPSSHSSCGGKNYMQVLRGKAVSTDNSSRGRFLKWVDTLNDGNNTPTHNMMGNAGNYLQLTNNDSPWNATPGVADSKPVNCRRAYHVLMTDGGWNYYNDYPMFNGDYKTVTAEIYDQHLDNVDGTSKMLPDGKFYDATSGETRIYSDPWGRQIVDAERKKSYWKGSNGTEYNSQSNCEKAKNNINCEYKLEFNWQDVVPTIADQAFYYWSTDLQPTIDNKLAPIVTKSGEEKFTVGSKSQVVSEYWNPKNNPATWQHMINYTIGYKTAATWPVVSTDPVFGSNTFDGDFDKLIVGDKKWSNPIQPPLHADRMPKRDDYVWYTVPSTTERYPKTFKVATKDIYADVEEMRQQELWHIALNSRGKFVPAPEPEDLVNAFKELVGSIVADNKTPVTSVVNSTASQTRTDGAEYNGGYEARGWKGYLSSDTVAKTTGNRTANEKWGTKTGYIYPDNRITTADKIDALSENDINNRLILTTNTNESTQKDKGVSFEWATDNSTLNATQRGFLNAGSMGNDRLNFIRGNRTKEGDTGTKPFRVRESRQGDVVNSQVWYVAQPVSNYSYKGYSDFAKSHKNRLPMLYVGGNDGMLHGFSAVDGQEKIAYVPKGVIKNLPELTKPGYQHLYFVDGSPFSGDINKGEDASPNWRSLLVGTLAAGGKGYFILDITKPGSPSTINSNTVSNEFTKSNASTLVVLDKTMHRDEIIQPDANNPNADIGYIFAPPVVDDINPHYTNQIALMNNGRWAAVMGNGYNSSNERPVLLVQYLTGNDISLKTIPAVASLESTNSKRNGLSAPRLVDVNGDGTPDVVYAGDLLGNLWKFDISSNIDTEWGVAFNGSPLYTAIKQDGSSSTAQSITAPPIVKPNDRGAMGLMVAFGTGRNITEGDRTDTSTQTIYSVLDNTMYKAKKVTTPKSQTIVEINEKVAPEVIGSGTSKLVEHTVGSKTTGSGTSSGMGFWKVSNEDVNFTGDNSKKGWFMHLPATGERILQGMYFYDGSNILEVISTVPGSGGSIEEESCAPSPKDQQKFRTFLNIMDGKRPSVQIVDTNGDTFYNLKDEPSTRMEAPITESRTFNKTKEIRTGANGSKIEFAKMPESSLRPSWRQLQ